MTWTNADAWTCPSCGRTEQVAGPADVRRHQRRHAHTHARQQSRTHARLAAQLTEEER